MHHARLLASLREPVEVIDDLVELGLIPARVADATHESVRMAQATPCGACQLTGSACRDCVHANSALVLMTQAAAAVIAALEVRHDVPPDREIRARAAGTALQAALRRAFLLEEHGAASGDPGTELT